VVAVWLTITAVLTYLDVPLRHSPLFAANIVLQASLGMLVFTWLLRGVAPSLLLLCGPGLILGGALAFAIFQVTGRGLVGVTVTTLTGAGAVVLLLRSDAPYEALDSRWWMLGQLIGLGVLATTSEFTELIPVAAILFALGYINGLRQGRFGWIRIPSVALAAVAVIALGFARKEYWWLITDDYLFFEVLSRHITESGPFADWGVGNFGRYHWLSYGWSGLLNTLSLEPPPLTTLTRVMPITYSLSTAASLTFIMNRLLRNKPTARTLLPIWVIIAITPLDWSGTSTAGVYAALTTLIATIISTTQTPSRRVFQGTLVCGISAILILTKLTAVFPWILLLLIVATKQVAQKMVSNKVRTFAILFGGLLSTLITLIAVWLVGKYLDLYQLVKVSPNLGQLAAVGTVFAGAAIGVRQLSLWSATGVMVMISRFPNSHHIRVPLWLNGFVAISLLIGSLLELSVNGHANTPEYLFAPFYFCASLSIAIISLSAEDSGPRGRVSLMPWIAGLSTLIAGIAWGSSNVQERFWSELTSVFSSQPLLRVELLRFVSREPRTASIVIALILLAVAVLRRQTSGVTQAIFLGLLLTIFAGQGSSAFDSYRVDKASEEVAMGLGSMAIQDVGRWLQTNSNEKDLVATNHGIRTSGGDYSNFSLAVWSQREYLTLGPLTRFSSPQASLDATDLSKEFAEHPDQATCLSLREIGVKWFVLEQDPKYRQNWSLCADSRYSIENLTVLTIKP